MFSTLFNPWILALVGGASFVAWLVPQLQAQQANKSAPDLDKGSLPIFESVAFLAFGLLLVVLIAPLPSAQLDVGGVIKGLTAGAALWWLMDLGWRKSLGQANRRWWGQAGLGALPLLGGLLAFKVLVVDRVSHFDFGAVLTGLFVVISVICIVGKLLGNRAKEADGSDHPTLELAKSLFTVVVIVLVLRQFIIEPFRIPSGSMMPTLLNGDFILVNKFAYGVRLPVTETKIIPVGKPKHGDVAVFRYPEQPEIDFIKRIVGLPGDTIRYANKELFINGEKIVQEFTGPYTGPQNKQFPRASEGMENLLGKQHAILVDFAPPGYRLRMPPAEEWTVPEGHYFVLGDNRDHSKDSRYWDTGSFVPEGNLAGKAFFIWMNFDPESGGPLFDRIFSKIQ